MRWAAKETGVGSRIRSVEPLGRGGWHVNHALTIADQSGGIHHVVLRRWARPGWESSDPDFTAERETKVLAFLERAAFPAPRVIAADCRGTQCGVPALLLTRLAGGPAARVEDESSLWQLAQTLARIHDLDLGQTSLPGYRPYVDLRARSIPVWLAGEVWGRAVETVQSEPRQPGARFIHRDYHPGNTLWSGRRLTGVVDWTQASVGPVEVDVGHMRWNLVVEYGLEAADGFLNSYKVVTRSRLPHQPYWDLVAVLDLVLDMHEPIAADELRRLEVHASRALSQLV